MDGWMDGLGGEVCVLGLVVCVGGCSWVWGDLVLSRSPPQIVKHTLVSTGWDMDRLAYIKDNHKPTTALYFDDIWDWGELDSAASKVHNNHDCHGLKDSRTHGLVGQQTHQPPQVMTKSKPLIYNTILIGQSIKRDPTAEIAEDSKSLILSHKDSIIDF